MTTNIGFRTLLVFPATRIQQRMLGLRRYESFEAGPGDGLGCFRGVLLALIVEGILIFGVALCWLLAHHMFHA
jgi:hypothetical protein